MNNGSSDLNGRTAETPLAPRSRPAGWPEPRRIPGLNTRLPLFEVALLLVAAALGWAAFQAYEIVNLSKREPDTTQDARDIGELLKLHSLMEVKERYALLADHLESGVAELRESLLVYLHDKDRGAIGRFRGKGTVPRTLSASISKGFTLGRPARSPTTWPPFLWWKANRLRPIS